MMIRHMEEKQVWCNDFFFSDGVYDILHVDNFREYGYRCPMSRYIYFQPHQEVSTSISRFPAVLIFAFKSYCPKIEQPPTHESQNRRGLTQVSDAAGSLFFSLNYLVEGVCAN